MKLTHPQLNLLRSVNYGADVPSGDIARQLARAQKARASRHHRTYGRSHGFGCIATAKGKALLLKEGLA